MVDQDLRYALIQYLNLRLSKGEKLKPSSPLFITQKGGSCSPHMALMLRDWAGIENTRSHSVRRSLITNVIHKQRKSVKIAQEIAGHVNPSIALIYEKPPEEAPEDALRRLD